MTTFMGEFQAFHTYIRFRIGVVEGEADFLMDGACQWYIQPPERQLGCTDINVEFLAEGLRQLAVKWMENEF